MMKKLIRPPRVPQSNRGVSLIEALVALLVLALGVMGMAGIQTRTLVESRTTNARSVAVMMADDLLDRMQANATVRVTNPATNPYIVGFNDTLTASNCMTSTCNGTQLAQFDLQQWKGQLAQLLPGGNARVFRSTTDPSQFGVLIGWNETQAKNEGIATTTAETSAYSNAIAVDTGVNGIACPADLTCHLVYIRP